MGTPAKFGQFTAYQFNRGTRVDQNQKLTESVVTITPISIAVHFVIDEYAADVAREDVMSFYGKRASEAIIRFEDKYHLTLLDGFSTSLGGGGAGKVGYLMAAYALISGNSTWPFQPPFNVVLHPYSYHDMAEDIAGLTSGGLVSGATNIVATSTDMRESVLAKYRVAKLAGLDVYIAGNLANTGNVAKGGVFHREALINTPFRPLTVKKQEDIKLDGWDVVTSLIFGNGEFEDAGGVELNLDAAAPTA